jgi:hypothetical protein
VGRPGALEKVTLEQAVERMGPIAEAFAPDQEMTGVRARQELDRVPRHLDVLEELAEGS